MSSTSEIQAKFDASEKRGLNFGAKIGPEQNAGSGGRVQVYQRGRIYWHPNTGAHEVHGGILKKYLEEGGPGANPTTGRRHFGYPISDETRTLDGQFPVSRFEFGDILFVAGTAGGVTIHGDFHKAWKKHGAEVGRLRYPLTEPVNVAGGKAVYFERGCLWTGPATNEEMITSILHPPLLGKPDLVQLASGEVRDFQRATWHGLARDLRDRILQTRPALFSELWRERLAVRRVAKHPSGRVEIGLLTQDVDFEETPLTVNVTLNFRLPTTGPIRPADRTLYDLVLKSPGNKTFAIAPHAFYMAKDWEDFGFIHVTDIHVASRIELFQTKLRRLASQNPELRQAAEQFNNFNDNFRDFIRYANHLHELGLLDLILATGDLVDYGFEPGKARSGAGGNYAFFEKLIRGQARSSSGVESEELRVPIFTVFGNHDYRVNPYTLLFDIDVPFLDDFTVAMYSPYNLTKEETSALQGGQPTKSKDDALEMVKIDVRNQRRLYDYYRERINAESSYTLDLGSHRVVMLDSQSDAGLPSNADLGTVISLAWNWMTDELSEDTKQGVNGSPNLIGLTQADVDRVRSALSAAGQSGLVIVGMHAPPLNIAGTELAHYFRETEHPTANRREVQAFLARHGASTVAKDWPRNGTEHFKTGTVDNLLDYGIARGETNAFLQACAGATSSRPADLVLCGHDHDRVEYRIRWDAARRHLLYFTDFYLENPATYYPSIKDGVDDHVHIRVSDTASTNGRVRQIRDHRFDPPLVFNQLDVLPYADPLDGIENFQALKAAWWARHRPLIVETAALGPRDHNQRVTGSTKPSTSFQGFRYFGVNDNVIRRSHYVVLDELRSHDFEMPWEKDNVIIIGPIAPVFPPVVAPEPIPDPAPSPIAGPVSGAAAVQPD